MEFKIGDLVKLKSGGPKMTVQSILKLSGLEKKVMGLKGYKDGDLTCVWFEKNERKSDHFDANSLIKVEEIESKIIDIPGLRF